MAKKNIFLTAAALFLSCTVSWAAGPTTSVSLSPCAQLLWRGADSSSDLRRLNEPQRLARQTQRDQDEVFAFFQNLAEFAAGRLSLEEATAYPNSTIAPNFLINDFVSVYSNRVQFDQFLIALNRLAQIFNIDSRDISRAVQLGLGASMRDTWENFFLNISRCKSKDSIYLVIFAVYLEVELSHQQSHTVAFLEDQVHVAFQKVFSGYVQHISNEYGVGAPVQSTVSSLSQSLQMIARDAQGSRSTTTVDDSAFKGTSAFYQALQKVDLKTLRTPLVDFELVLMPLLDHLSRIIGDHPELGEEMIRRAEKTIREQFDEKNENYIITLAKISPISSGTTKFIYDAFNLSKF
ncbi:MAG: hypothetical protein IPJ71_10115 [Bdellovibrionales bacterium]|nr:hypothetical protein [Bdellovibrionales bacterium]